MEFSKACQLLLDVPLEQREGATQSIALSEKLAACRTVADHLTSKATRCAVRALFRVNSRRTVTDFRIRLNQGISMLLRIYGDREMSVWSVAEECLNRIIKSLLCTDQSDRIFVELYRGLKASNVRSSRFALTKLAEICHLSNPKKRRKLMLSLTPIFRLIIERQDETLQESLSAALAPIAKFLGPYLVEREQRDLLVRLLRNLGSAKSPIRRAAASSALAWAQGCGLLPFLIDAVLRMATQQSRFFTPSKLPEAASPQRQWIPTDPDCEVGALVGLAHIFRITGAAAFDTPRPLTPMLQLAFSALRGNDHNAACSGLDLIAHLLPAAQSFLKLESLGEIVSALERTTRATVRCAVLGALASLSRVDAAAVTSAIGATRSTSLLGSCSQYLTDEDPALRAAAVTLLVTLVESSLSEVPSELPRILSYLEDATSSVARAALASLQTLLRILVNARACIAEIFFLIEAILTSDRNSHFLFRMERLSFLVSLPWARLFELQPCAALQKRSLTALCVALGDTDGRVGDHAASLFVNAIHGIYVPHILSSVPLAASLACLRNASPDSTPVWHATKCVLINLQLLLRPAAALSAEFVVRTVVTTALRPSRPLLVRGAVKALVCVAEGIAAARDAVGGRLESPVGTALMEVIQVTLGCLSLPSLAADTELLGDFCRLLTAALSAPIEAVLWEPLAQLLMRLLKMFVSAIGDQPWVLDQATPADESSSQALLFQKLVSSRAVAMVSLKQEKYEELVSACLRAYAVVIRVAGVGFASLVNDSIPLLTALIDEEPCGSIACVEALCSALIPRRVVQPPAPSVRVASVSLSENLSLLFNRTPVKLAAKEPPAATPALALIPNPKETLRVLEPLVVRAVQRYRYSRNPAEQEATLNLLGCLALRGIDFNKLDADKKFLAFLRAQPQEQSVVLPSLVKFIATTIESVPELVPDSAAQEFLTSLFQLPAKLDYLSLSPLVVAAFRSPQTELEGLRDVCTQRLLALLDTDRSALSLLAVALDSSAKFLDRYRALSAHISDALLRLACADRPAVSSLVELDCAIALCNNVALLDGGAQAIVGAMGSVLPPLLRRQRATFVQSVSIDEALLAADNITWLPSAIILIRLAARYCPTEEHLFASWPAPASSNSTVTPSPSSPSDAIAQLLTSALLKVASLRPAAGSLILESLLRLFDSTAALLGVASLPTKRAEGQLVRALQRQIGSWSLISDAICALNDTHLLLALLPIVTHLFIPAPALCDMAYAPTPRTLNADLCLIAVAQLAVLNPGSLSVLPAVSPSLLFGVVRLLPQQAPVQAFSELLIKGRIVEVEEALSVLDAESLPALALIDFISLMPPSGVCLATLAALQQRVLSSDVLAKLEKGITKQIEGLLTITHKGDVDRQQLFKVLEPMQALPVMKEQPRFLDLLKAVLYRRSRPSEAPPVISSVEEIVVRNALAAETFDFRLLAVLPAGMPEHLGAKKRALCGPFENLNDASAQEIVALLAYVRGALQTRSAFRELAVPLAALFSLEHNVTDGIDVSSLDQLEQAVALIRACAGNEVDLEAALTYTAAVASGLGEGLLTHALGKALLDELFKLYAAQRPSLLLQLPLELRSPSAVLCVLVDGLRGGHPLPAGQAFAHVIRILSRSLLSDLYNAEDLRALSDVAWATMPSKVDLLGAGDNSQFQLVWRSIDAGLRASAQDVDPGTRVAMIESAVSILLQAFMGGSIRTFTFAPREPPEASLPNDAIVLYANVKQRASSALGVLSRIIAYRTSERTARFPLHGNIERGERQYYFGQVPVGRLRAFDRHRFYDLDSDEFLIDAVTLLEQLLSLPHPPAVRLAALEAIVLLSDLFSHPRFIWLYGILQRLHVESEPTDDVAVQPYTIVGMCKAVAVLQWDKDQSRYEFLGGVLHTSLARGDLSLLVSCTCLTGNAFRFVASNRQATDDIQIVRPLISLITRHISRVLEDPTAGRTLQLHCFALAFMLLKHEPSVASDEHFMRQIIDGALICGGLPLVYLADLQERLSALSVGASVVRFADTALGTSREPLAFYFSLLSLVVLSFGRQREAVVFAEMEKTKILVARLHDSPLLAGRVVTPVLLRLLQQLTPADALSACLSDALKLSQRGNAHLLVHVFVPLLLSLRQRVRLHPWIVDASASFLEVRPTANVRAALTVFFLASVLADFPFLGLFSGKGIRFAEELFVLAGKEFFASMKNKQEEDMLMAVLEKHLAITECASLLSALQSIRK